MTDELHTRIARGVQFLDDTIPNWAEQIDLLGLDLANPYSCVLGQLEGSFNLGARRVDEYEGDRHLLEDPDYVLEPSVEYGFDSDRFAGIEYEELQEAWTNLILEKRKAGPDQG